MPKAFNSNISQTNNSPRIGKGFTQLQLVIVNVFAKVLRAWNHHKGTSNSQYRENRSRCTMGDHNSGITNPLLHVLGACIVEVLRESRGIAARSGLNRDRLICGSSQFIGYTR